MQSVLAADMMAWWKNWVVAATPAIGWAMGIERLVSLYEISNERVANTVPHIYIVTDGDMALHKGFDLSRRITREFSYL